MKKTLFTVLLICIGSAMCLQASMLSPQEYYPENGYSQEGEYTYDQGYDNVDWAAVSQEEMYYCYYDSDNVFLVTLGHRVFLIPYDFFYSSIWTHHRHRLRYCTYNYFADWWGIGFYNHIWDRYYWRHNSRYYRRGHNYYNDHRNRPPTVLRRNELQAPRYRSGYQNGNRYTQRSARYSNDSYRRYNAPVRNRIDRSPSAFSRRTDRSSDRSYGGSSRSARSVFGSRSYNSAPRSRSQSSGLSRGSRSSGSVGRSIDRSSSRGVARRRR